MSLAKICSGAVYGVDAYPVEIEACPPKPCAKEGECGGRGPDDRGGGIAGRGSMSCRSPALAGRRRMKESTDRVWTALINSGFCPPDGRTTVILAPADIEKEGPSFDLPTCHVVARSAKTDRAGYAGGNSLVRQYGME